MRKEWYSFYFIDEYTIFENNAINTRTGMWPSMEAINQFAIEFGIEQNGFCSYDILSFTQN